jgi:hypothetical protein
MVERESEGMRKEGGFPMLFLAHPRDDVDVCFVTDSQRSGSDHSCVVSARIPDRASIPCFCPTRLCTSPGLGFTRDMPSVRAPGATTPASRQHPSGGESIRTLHFSTHHHHHYHYHHTPFPSPRDLFVSLQSPVSLFSAHQRINHHNSVLRHTL